MIITYLNFFNVLIKNAVRKCRHTTQRISSAINSSKGHFLPGSSRTVLRLKNSINLVVSFLIYYGFTFISIYLFIRARQGIQRSIFKDRGRLNNGDPKLHRPQAARAGFNLEPRVLQDFITSSVATVDRPTSDTLVLGSDQWALASTQKQ